MSLKLAIGSIAKATVTFSSMLSHFGMVIAQLTDEPVTPAYLKTCETSLCKDSEKSMQFFKYMISSVDTLTRKYPYAGLFITGDLSQAAR
jgi:hypothetical protein